MAIKFSQFNLRTDHTSGMYLVGYDGNQNIHITVDNLFDDFINGTENTIAMFGTDGTVLADSIITQSGASIGVAGAMTVTSDATFSTNIEVEGTADFNGNVNLGDESGDLITQNGTLYLNGPVKDTTDTLGAVDQVLLSDATGELTFTDLADLHVGGAEVVEVPVKNVQGSALVKGDPVYISGSVGASGRLEIQLADASNTLKMPAVGLLKQDLANNAEGFAVVTGKLRNLITDPIDGITPTENDVIYVKPSGTSGAALTTTKPVYGNFIQNIGKVGRVSTSNDGNFVVSSILRTNDIPNLTPGRLWIGSTGNTIESQTLFVDEANERLGIGTASPSNAVHVVGTGIRIISTATNANNGEIRLGTVGNNNIPQIRMGNSSNPDAFRISNAGYWSIGTYSNSDLRFNVNSTTAMHIESTNQYVGIGTTSPGSTLTVRRSGTGSPFRIEDSGGVVLMNVNEDALGNAEVRLNDSSGTQTVRLDTSGSSYFTGGNVGIGTNLPGAKLEVDGDIRLTNTTRRFQFANNNVGAYRDTNNRLVLAGYGGIDFNAESVGSGMDSQARRMRIKPSGQIQFDEYGAGTFTGTATKNLSVTSSGAIIETDAVPVNIVETITTTDGTYINLTPNSATDGAVTITADLSATGTADATKYLRGDNTWATITGVYDWDISDGTNSETIVNGDTVTFSGDTYITTSYAAGTNTLSIDHDDTTRVDTTSSASPGYGGTFTVVDSVTTNTTGHLEAINVKTVTMPSADDTNTTYDLSGYGTTNGTAGVQLVGSDSTTDQVAITGAGTTTVAHSGNTLTITSNDQYTGTVDGSGTANYVTKWLDTDTITDSVIYDDGTDVGIGTATPNSKLQVDGAVQVADDTDTASADKVGALRYRTSGNNSYVDMCMQTGATTYAWVNVVQNNW